MVLAYCYQKRGMFGLQSSKIEKKRGVDPERNL